VNFDINDLFFPRFTQPEVLAVSGLRPDTLQTWINRQIIKLDAPSPGSGRRRLYSMIHIIQLTIMARLHGTYGITPTSAARLSLEALTQLAVHGTADRQAVMVLTRHRIVFEENGKVIRVEEGDLTPSFFTGSPDTISLTDLARISGSVKNAETGFIDGADSMLIFRMGEIIHSVIAQLSAIESEDA